MKQFADGKGPEESALGAFANTREEEALHKTLKSEKKKLSELQGGEKAEYIFMYYKWYFVVAILAIAMIIYIIHHALTYTSTTLYIDVLNSSVGNTDREVEITEYCQMEKHDVARIETAVDTEADPAAGVLYKQIDIYTAANQIDVVFADQAGAEYVAGLGITQRTVDMLPTDLYELWKDRMITLSVYDINSDDAYFDAEVGIDISGTKVAEYFELSDNTKYLLISGLSGNQVYLQDFLQMLYDIETGAYTY